MKYSRQQELVALAGELRKKFGATEKKLADSRMPAEILRRHHDFVAGFNSHFAELNSKLAAIIKAVPGEEEERMLEEAIAYFKKVRKSGISVYNTPNSASFI